MAPTLDDVYGSVGYVGRARSLSSDELASVVRAIAQLEVEKSQSTDRSRKLLVEQEANQVDAAANVADTFTKLKAARIQGNSDAYNAYAKVLVGQMDTLSKTSWDVASREFAPLFMAARQAEAQNKDGDPKVDYWSTIGGGLLGMIKTPYGEAYADQLLATASQGGRDWRKELKQGTFEYQQMEDLERIAEENKQVRGNADAWVASINLKLGNGGFSASDLTKGPSEDAAIENAINRATNGMDVDTLKANVADSRSTVDNSGMDDNIAMMKKMLGEKTGKSNNSGYIRTLQHPEFQAWAKDHGFVVGQVLTNPDGSFAGVKPGKDDYLAAKGYVYQMKRDPTARQRRWRASHDIVRLDWNEDEQAAEPLRPSADMVQTEMFGVADKSGGIHIVTKYYDTEMKNVIYKDQSGATLSKDQVDALGDKQLGDGLVNYGVLYNDTDGLAHANVLNNPEAFEQARQKFDVIDVDRAQDHLKAENTKKQKASAGSPQYAYGVDLGLAGGHGVRVIIDEDGKRRTVPASAKVTRLESLTPEHVSELDKLRANRVNQAVKRTDALTDEQKAQQLGTLDEPMGLKEKIEEAKRQDMAENKAARERENESRLPSTGDVTTVGGDREINEDSSDKAAAPVATSHAEGARYTDAATARRMEAYPAQEAARYIEDKKVSEQAEKENVKYTQGVPTSATLVDPESGLSGVPGAEIQGRVMKGAPDSAGRPTMSAPAPNVETVTGPRSIENMRAANATSVRAGGLPSPVLSRKQLSHTPDKFTMSAKQEPEEVAPRSLRATAWGKTRREDRLRQLSNKAAEQADIAATNANDAARKMQWDEERRVEEEKNKAMRQAIEYGAAGQSRASP